MLDTSVAIHLRDSDPGTLAKIGSIDEPICLSIITQVELEGGVVRATESRGHRRYALDRMLLAYTVLPFGEDDATAYRAIVEALGFSRPMLLDRLIAAQAIVAGARIVTRNARDFAAIPKLVIDDWSA